MIMSSLLNIFLGASLSAKLRQVLFDMFNEFKGVFGWTYAKMAGLDPQLVMHKLNMKE